MKPLPVPDAAIADDDSIQMLSAWIAQNGLHCSLNIGMWKDMGIDEPRAWGMLLADAIRHIADAHHAEYGAPHEQTIGAIQRGLLNELGDPTTKTEGEFYKGAN
jgi:hypothetical protein